MKRSSSRSWCYEWLSVGISALAVSLLVLASGCNRGMGLSGNQYQVPWPDETGNYRLQNITIDSFDQPRALQGRFIHLFVDPYVVDGKLSSGTPIGRFVTTENGVHVPADFTSLQATAIHGHFERLAAIDQALGVTLQWPMRIGIQSNMTGPDGPLRNNAIFDSHLDSLLIVPYTETSVPIALNAGILAHEHFHMIFQALVLSRLNLNDSVIAKPSLDAAASPAHALCDWRNGAVAPLPQVKAGGSSPTVTTSGDDQRPEAIALYNTLYVRAINEGFADFWGWVYTGDARFIGHSLPQQSDRRRIDLRVEQLPNQSMIQNMTRSWNGEPLSDAQLVANAYAIGSEYARVLHELALESSDAASVPALGLVDTVDASADARIRAGRALIAALPHIADGLAAAQKAGTYFSPGLVLQALAKELPSASSVCETVLRVSSASEDGMNRDANCPKPAPVASPVPSPAPSPSPLAGGEG